MSNLGVKLYYLFLVSWFLNLGFRLPFLGAIRFDLILIIVISAFVLFRLEPGKDFRDGASTLIKLLIFYSIVTIPLVEWPGSVIGNGLPELIKAVVFYYFTVALVRTERDLGYLIFVFVGSQSFRVVQPLYLHLREGYWGSAAYMVDGTNLDRLAGAPGDWVNPNGLAFVICTILPFLYFLAGLSWKVAVVSMCLIPASVYALLLTGSRSGIVGLAVILLGIVIKSRKRSMILLSCLVIVPIGFQFLNADMQDRYLSLFGMGDRNAATVAGRLEGIEEDLDVVLRRPLFGHGLGTSLEANVHFRGEMLRSHNLYTEIAQELGVVGLVIFLLLMRSVFLGFVNAKKALGKADGGPLLPRLLDAMQVWLAMNFIFSFASYGLSSYVWYFFAGLSVVMQRLARGRIRPEDTKFDKVSGSHRIAGRVFQGTQGDRSKPVAGW